MNRAGCINLPLEEELTVDYVLETLGGNRRKEDVPERVPTAMKAPLKSIHAKHRTIANLFRGTFWRLGVHRQDPMPK